MNFDDVINRQFRQFGNFLQGKQVLFEKFGNHDSGFGFDTLLDTLLVENIGDDVVGFYWLNGLRLQVTQGCEDFQLSDVPVQRSI